MVDLNTKKVVFAGAARDCAKELPLVLANVERLAPLFGQAVFMFFENDSKDDTKAVLKSWLDGREGGYLAAQDGLAAQQPHRTLRLAIVRQAIIDAVRAQFADFDYLVLLDCDDVNVRPIDPPVFARAVRFLQDSRAAGIFANAEGFYYDLWALRQRERCPGDIWEEMCDYALAHGTTDRETFAKVIGPKLFLLAPAAQPMEVESAFGGLGVYRIESVLRNNRPYAGSRTKVLPAGVQGLTETAPREFGWLCCEHVAFNAGFRANGERLYVMPSLINIKVDHHGLVPGSWRAMLLGPTGR